MATNQVNPLSQMVPIVDPTGRPTLEFILKWNAQQAAQNAIAVKDSDVVFTDNTVGNASTVKHGYLRKLSGIVTQFLAGDGVFRAPPYDVNSFLPTVTGPANVFRFVAARAVLVAATTCAGSALTAPAGGAAVFTIKKNGASIGTLTFADGVATATAAGAGGAFAIGDVLTIDVGADHGIAGVALTVTGSLA